MDLSTAVELLKERRISAVIYAPGNISRAEDPIKITLYTLSNDLQGAIVDVRLKNIFLQVRAGPADGPRLPD